MRVSNRIISMGLAILLAGCAAPTASPTPSPTATAAPLPTSTPTSVPDPVHLDPVGQFGGRAISLAFRGNTAFVVVGDHLETIDVSDPTMPRRVGQSKDFPHAQGPLGDYSLAVAGRYLLMGNWNAIQIFDAPSDGDARFVTEISMDDSGIIEDVVVSGQVAYVAINQFGLLVFDISDPTAPEIIARVPIEYGVSGIAKSGSLIVVEGQQVTVIDVSDPASPRILSSIPVAINIPTWWLTISGDRVITASGVYDLSDPASPRLLKETTDVCRDWEHDSEVAVGQLVFNAEGNVYDFSGSGDHVLVDHPLDLPDSTDASGDLVAVRGHYMFRTGSGLQIFDLSLPPTRTESGCRGGFAYQWQRVGYLPTEIARVQLDDREDRHDFSEIHVVGDYLYTFSLNTLFIWSREDPAHPVLARMLAIPDQLEPGIQIDSGILFPDMDDGSGESAWFLDTKDPANPALSKLPFPVTTGEVKAAAGGLLLKTAHAAGDEAPTATLEIYDMADPVHPALAGSAALMPRLDTYTIAGSIVYVRSDSSFSPALDISDPANPRPAGSPSLAVERKSRGEVILPITTVTDGKTLFVVGQDKITTYALDDLSTPLGTLDIWLANGGWVWDGLVWVRGAVLDDPDRTESFLIDVDDPAHPHILYLLSATVNDAARDGRYLYGAVYGSEIYVYQLPAE